MKSKSLDLNQLLIKTEEKRQQELGELKSCSKQLSELVVEENFIVNKTMRNSYATSFTPYSEMIIRGEPLIYQGGFTSKLVLKVTPENKNIPIKTLNFEGSSSVRAGDYISAKIPRYEEKRVEGRCLSGCFKREQIFYLDREFNLTESAIEISVLSEKGQDIAKSIDYKKFRKG